MSIKSPQFFFIQYQKKVFLLFLNYNNSELFLINKENGLLL